MGMAASFESLIKTYESVAHRDDGKRRQFSLQGPQAALLFYGSQHVREVGHPMWEEIKEALDNMNPDLIFVEGINGLRREVMEAKRAALLNEILGLTLLETVRRFGESGFSARYAAERGIAVECPEPSFKEEVRHVEQLGFSRDGIVAYYVYRMVHQWLNTPGAPTLEEYLTPSIDELCASTGWGDYDWALPNIFSLSEKFWGAPLKKDQKYFYARAVAPFGSRREGTGIETNEVCSASALFRDQAIARAIVGAQGRAKRIAVVYGSGHSFTLEEALKAAFSAP